MDEDVKYGMCGCLTLFFVVGVILTFCLQCSHERQIQESEKRDAAYRESVRKSSGRIPRVRDTCPAAASPRPVPRQHSVPARQQEPWEAAGYDSFEDWYYAEMDVFGEGEYPDM